MARIIEAEARISAVDATGRTFQEIAQKVRGLAGTMKSLGGAANSGMASVNRTVGRLQSAMHTLAPVASGAAAFEGMRGVHGIIHEAVQATAERAHEAVRMDVSGMSDAEISEAERVSGDLSQRYKALSTTTIMHALRNMRAIVGTYEEAGKILDPVLKLRVAAMGAHPEHAAELAEDFDKLIKGMEIKGVTMDPEKFTSYMQGMAKAINVFGDTLRPTDYYEMFKYGRQSTQSLSEKFMLETAPTMAQELGGSGAGKAMSSFYQAIVGGRVKESAVKEMLAVGLIGDKSKIVRSRNGSVKGMLPGAVKNWQLAASDPYAWINQVVLPAYKKAGITEPDAIQAHLGTMFQSANAAQMAGIFATQQPRIEKDWNLIHGAKGLEAADIFQSKDPFIAMQGVTEQWHNLLAIAGGPLAEPAAKGMNALAAGIVAIENAAAPHPLAATAGLGGALALGGAASVWALKKSIGLGKSLLGLGGGGTSVADLSGDAAIRAMQSALPSSAGPTIMGTVGSMALKYGLGPVGALLGMTEEANKGERRGAAGGVYPNFSLGDVHSALGMPAAEVKGSAELNVSVQVEPSDGFISRLVSALRNDINAFTGGGGGTAGSTGVSMPEATPNP